MYFDILEINVKIEIRWHPVMLYEHDERFAKSDK